MNRICLLFIVICLQLSAATIETFYGPLEVEEKVLIELIHSPAFQRLKSVHQYGVLYYTTHKEEYTRFEHSLGVFAILRASGASLEEQIAGLLHDVSHTAFSHAADFIFDHGSDDYQTSIHNLYLATSGLEAILNRHGYTTYQVSPKKEGFVRLEQSLPELCADRIDYNIQGAYYQHFLTLDEAKALFHDLIFKEGKWLLTNESLALKLANSSLFMSQNCWGSVHSAITSKAFAKIINHAFTSGLISFKEFHFGADQVIWDKLCKSQDPFIQTQMQIILHPKEQYELTTVEKATTFLPFKCRGIDPQILKEGKALPLSQINAEYAKALTELRAKAKKGWPIIQKQTAESVCPNTPHSKDK